MFKKLLCEYFVTNHHIFLRVLHAVTQHDVS